jgi:hypothetical protein
LTDTTPCEKVSGMDQQEYRHAMADSIPDTWKCSKHGTLPITEFYRCRHQVKYWRWKCKQCQHDSIVKRYHADPKASHAKNYAWREANKEKWRDISQKWYIKHGHELKSRMKSERVDRRMEVIHHYGGENPQCGICNETNIEFLVIDHINGDGAKHRATIGKVTDGMYRWIIKNNFPNDLRVLCQNCNAIISQHNLRDLIRISLEDKYSNQKRNAKLRLIVLNYYSPNNIKCACCGLDDVSKLAIDHINGGGRQMGKTSTALHRWLIKNNFPPGFRILCNNCNHSFGAYGYCPHQVKTEDSCSTSV